MLYAGHGSQQGARRKTEPDWAYVHHELRRPGVTLMLLWEEYRQREPDGYRYSRWCELYRAWEGRLSPTMRQAHPAGERMFVDYAGQTVDLIDPGTGEVRAGADLRRGDGRLQLHLRRGDADPEPAGLDRRACPGACLHGRRAGAAGARQPEGRGRSRQLVRARPQPDLSRPGDALPHGDPADPHAQAARQGEGRGCRAGGRALDIGAAAQPALLLARRAEPGDLPSWSPTSTRGRCAALASAGATCSSNSTARR